MEIMFDVVVRFMDHVGIPTEVVFLVAGIIASFAPIPRKLARIITGFCLILALLTYAHGLLTQTRPANSVTVIPAVDTSKMNEGVSQVVQDYSRVSLENDRLRFRLENAAEVLESFFYSGENLEDYYLNAQKVLREKSDSGYPEAQFYLGYMLDPKHSKLKNFCPKLTQSAQEAKRYYKMAADNGHTMSLSFLGNIYYDEKDYASAADCYKTAADKGDQEAQYTLGYMYGKGLVDTVIDTSHYTEKFREGFTYGMSGN